MFKAGRAGTVEEYLDRVPDERKPVINYLHEFIQKSAPGLRPHFTYNMLGYGSFKYQNYKKQMVAWPVVALANQKNYVSPYICAVERGEYRAEKHKAGLGKVSVGKSCVRLKKLEDVNLPALKKIIKLAAARPGLAG